MIDLLFKLIIGHAFADFAFQSDVMAKGKNKNNKTIPPIGQKYFPCWTYWLTAHALVNCGVIYLITNNAGLALIEFISHWIIDYNKCDNKLTVHQDQALHFMTLLIIAILYWWGNV
jgi:hypothetical protein